MRNILLILVLVSIGLTSPALADWNRGDQPRHEQQRNDQRVEQNSRDYAQHDRGEKYGHFQQRMDHLRKDLRHERRDHRRFERKVVRRELRQDDRHWHRQVPVVEHRRSYVPMIFPNVVVRIPLFW